MGNLLLQQEGCPEVPPLPLAILLTQPQGQIRYIIESTLDSKLVAMGNRTGQPLVSLISHVVVGEEDPAFRNPSRPIPPV